MSIKDEILNLADKNKKFKEIISRPSFLRMVATVWEQKLSKQSGQINSALVMDEYIKHTNEHQSDRKVNILYDTEQAYFMEGIAAYMVVNDLPNQIGSEQLHKVIRDLFHKMPNEVSLSSLIERNPKILKHRLDFDANKQMAIEIIENDVRSRNLLVTDLTKLGLTH